MTKYLVIGESGFQRGLWRAIPKCVNCGRDCPPVPGSYEYPNGDVACAGCDVRLSGKWSPSSVQGAGAVCSHSGGMNHAGGGRWVCAEGCGFEKLAARELPELSDAEIDAGELADAEGAVEVPEVAAADTGAGRECRHCGQVVRAADVFCVYCGGRLNPASEKVRLSAGLHVGCVVSVVGYLMDKAAGQLGPWVAVEGLDGTWAGDAMPVERELDWSACEDCGETFDSEPEYRYHECYGVGE